MNSPSPPPAPDPAATIAAQSAANKEGAIATANMNRVDQYGPQGQVNYTQIGTNEDGTPKYRQDTSYSPEYQKMFENQTGIANKLGEFGLAQGEKVGALLSQPFDVNSAAEDKIVNMQRARLDPQWQQQEDGLRTQLINSGMRPGTEAYDREMQNFSQRKQDAYNSIYINGRQQAVSEAQLNRSVPLNELMATMTGNQVQNPQYSGVAPANVATTDAAGIINSGYQNQMSAYNAQQSQSNAMMGGLFGLGGAAMKFMPWSDRRLKTDIVRVGTGRRGLPLYQFRYIWGGDIELGYMAQEVEAVAPHAVGELDGFKFVNLEEV